MSQDHVCYGAECRTCSPFRPGRITFGLDATAEIAHQTRRMRHLKDAIVRGPLDAARAARLATFRDSRGESLATWPQQVGVGTAVIIFAPDEQRGRRIVLHKRRDNGWWGLPGGKMDVGETIEQCAQREALEETGLSVELQRLACIDSSPEHYAICCYPDGNVIQFCCLTFVAHVTGGLLTISGESLELGWYNIEQLPEPFLPAHRWRIEQAFHAQRNAIPVR